MRRRRLHAEVTPECSRATSAAAHGAHGCCGMLFFRLCASRCFFLTRSNKFRQRIDHGKDIECSNRQPAFKRSSICLHAFDYHAYESNILHIPSTMSGYRSIAIFINFGNSWPESSGARACYCRPHPITNPSVFLFFFLFSFAFSQRQFKPFCEWERCVAGAVAVAVVLMVRFLRALAVCLCAVFSLSLSFGRVFGRVVGDGVGRRWGRRGWGGRWALFDLLFFVFFFLFELEGSGGGLVGGDGGGGDGDAVMVLGRGDVANGETHERGMEFFDRWGVPVVMGDKKVVSCTMTRTTSYWRS